MLLGLEGENKMLLFFQQAVTFIPRKILQQIFFMALSFAHGKPSKTSADDGE